MNKKAGFLKFLIAVVFLPACLLLFLKATPNGFWGRTEGVYFANSNGVKIFYNEYGRGEPVVLLHGFAANGDLNWRLTGVREKLGAKYHLIIPDLRGHGLSAKPHEPSQYGALMAQDISELLKSLGISKAVIAGYSLGGFVALKFAQLYPEQVKNVLVMGAGWDEIGPDSLAEKLKPAAVALRNSEGVPPLSTFFNPKSEPGNLHRVWVYMLTKIVNDPLALAAMIEGAEGLTISSSELAGIQTIPCVIVGSEDPFYNSAEKIKAILPAAEILVIENKNHMTAVTSKELIQQIHHCIH